MTADEVIAKYVTLANCARSINVNYMTLHAACRKGKFSKKLTEKIESGIALPIIAGMKGWSNRTEPDERDKNVIAAFKSGVTLQKIGDSYGISREYVRVLLKRFGLTRKDGGSGLVGKKNREKRAHGVNVRCLSRTGMPHDEYKKYTLSGASRAYAYQKRSAQYRALAFDFSFSDWWRIWEESGKWDQRGRGANNYCMARISDAGGYVAGNVYITTNAENGREYQRTKKEPTQRVDVGVYKALPGYSKPYLVRVSNKCVGYYKTADEAITARRDYLASREAAHV